MLSLKKITTTGSGLLMLAVAVVALNIIAARLFVRLDVTGDKVFSLSDGTKKILGKLDGDVTAKLYFSRSNKDLPPVIKTYATRVEEVLAEYAAKSGGKLKVEVIDPKPDTDDEEWAQKYGISGVRLPKGDQVYFGVVFTAGAKEVALPYLDPRREELLEYDLSEALVSAFKKDVPKIGVMSSLPVFGGGPGGQGGERWVFLNDLQRSFTVEEVAPTAKEVAEDLKVLVVIHPKNLAEEALYAIDQFVMRGGRLIVAVDPMSRTDLQTNPMAGMQGGQMPQASSELTKLFDAWGIAYDKNQMVGDQSLATRINAGGQVTDYPFFLTLSEKSFATTNAMTASLRQMMLGEAGAVSLKDGATGVTLEPLITTSKDSGTGPAQMAAFMAPADLAREMKADGKERVVAGLFKGRFKSAFPQGAPAQAASGSAEAPKKPHKAEAEQDGTIVVVGDADFLADANAVDKIPFGNQVMVRVRNDNLNFLTNAVDVLGGNPDLISVRSRGKIARPFTRVQEIQVNAQKKWQAEEEKLTAQLSELQKKLNDLQAQRTDGNRYAMTPQQQTEIERFRAEERDVKVRRREVRKNLREDIERLGSRLVAMNLLLVPAACTAFGLGVFARRTSLRRRAKEQKNG